jgi:folate-binding protein YgfZ
MSDNPRYAPVHEFDLPGHTVLAITGRDAVTFAQAQFMNDVVALADGQWQWNGWLTPKGRVVALFALLRRDAETLWLLLTDVAARDIAHELQRFVFRSKVVLSPVDACVSGCFTAPAVAQGASFTGFDQGDIELDMGGDGGPRSLRIGTAPAPEDADALARWNAADLAHGLPRLPAAQAAQWTPQQLSLERLRAYSVKKGCYPGQEIVARTHFLGQAKRGLALFDADAPVSTSDEVRAGERSIGTIVSVSATTTLAVLPLEREAESDNAMKLDANGIALHERPLRGGLER